MLRVVYVAVTRNFLDCPPSRHSDLIQSDLTNTAGPSTFHISRHIIASLVLVAAAKRGREEATTTNFNALNVILSVSRLVSRLSLSLLQCQSCSVSLALFSLFLSFFLDLCQYLSPCVKPLSLCLSLFLFFSFLSPLSLSLSLSIFYMSRCISLSLLLF
jgi:hypothetical protein